MEKSEPITRFVRKLSSGRFKPAMGPATVCGVFVETDDATGLARRTAALRLGGVLTPTEPLFWVE